MDRIMNAVAYLALTALAAVALLAQHQPSSRSEFVGRSLTHDGLRRSYQVHFPLNRPSASPRPVVLVLHGGNGADARTMARRTGYNALADREGFIVVYPSGIDGQWNDGRGSAFGRAPDNRRVDDVGFISAVIDDVVRRREADPERVYVTGFSNGGMMTFRLGIEIGDRLAAIAAGIANLPVNLRSEMPVRPLPVLVMNGTEDPMVPWEGGPVRVFRRDYGEVLSTEQTVRFWADAAQIRGAPTTRFLPDRDPNDGCRVEVRTFRSAAVGPEVVLYALHGGGHTIPGGNTPDRPRLVGRQCRDIDAAEVMWEFLRVQSRPAR
jgi:polyhydroxybutyrate depolymerase